MLKQQGKMDKAGDVFFFVVFIVLFKKQNVVLFLNVLFVFCFNVFLDVFGVFICFFVGLFSIFSVFEDGQGEHLVLLLWFYCFFFSQTGMPGRFGGWWSFFL